jgi:hypothetical protein
LLEEGVRADLTIQVGDEKFSMGSPVFKGNKAQLFGPMWER